MVTIFLHSTYYETLNGLSFLLPVTLYNAKTLNGHNTCAYCETLNGHNIYTHYKTLSGYSTSKYCEKAMRMKIHLCLYSINVTSNKQKT